MDTRRLDTAQVLAMGIPYLKSPNTEFPHDREQHEVDYDGEGLSGVADALDRGLAVSASNYYGIPQAWKNEDGKFRCVLLQYRAVTEDEIFDTTEEATEWFEDMFRRTQG